LMNFAGMPGADSMIGGAIRQVPGAMIKKIVAKLREKLESLMTAGGAVDTGGGAAAGAGVQRWAPTVLAALARVGQPASLLQTVLRRMQQESGGNPNIANNWDINAQRGDPSRGLMQVIGATFRAFRDPGLPNNVLDPMANIVASMRYAMNRYGSLSAAYNRPGGYDEGGVLSPGRTLATNLTRKPEAVLTNDQWHDVHRSATSAVDGTQLEQLVRAIVAETQPLFGALHVTTTPRATAQDIIGEATFRARAARRLGVHN
jgi:SLT domain-containing protein